MIIARERERKGEEEEEGRGKGLLLGSLTPMCQAQL